MDPNLIPTSSVYLMILILTLIHLPTSLSQDNEQYYTNCGQLFQCGTISNISYPFWGGDRPEYCGRPELQLNCEDGAPWLTIQSRKYRVLTYNNATRSIIVVGEEFYNTSCPRFLYNTTLDAAIFFYGSNTQDLYLYYGCTGNPIPSLTPNEFECNVNDTRSSSYYTTSDVGSITSGSCNHRVVVRVSQEVAVGLVITPPSINISEALAQGFALQWTADNANCDECDRSGGRCGYDANSRSFTCYCPDGSHQLTSCNPNRNGNGNGNGNGSTKGTKLGLKLAIGLSAGLASIIVVSIVIICCIRKECLLYNTMNFRKEQTLKDQNVEAFIRNYCPLAPNRYKYSDIKGMTNSFREKLGQGGFGSVYKGKLSDGRLVAVKLLSETTGANGEDFVNEVASISRTSHVNVVTLLGFCYQNQKRALVYEFMPNGSLDKFINNERSPNTNSQLECKTLYQIAVGIARGLEYLHRGCNTRIVHFDIKPHNILLDEDFCPKISDFGLAKLCRRKESIVSMMGARGTIGYIAPEVFCRNFGGVSYKSDVYSYGMMVLEMIGAREKVEVGSDQISETYFPDWIYEHLENTNDLRLNVVTTEEEKEIARKMILASLWCIQTNPSERPSMSKVVEMLEGSLESLQIPPKPYLFSTIPSVQDSSITLSEVLEKQEISVEQIV